YHERHFLPLVVPTGFRKFVPILISVEIDGILYSVTHMKQYDNASVVNIETEVDSDNTNVRFEHAQFELFIAPEYQCRPDGGYGHHKGMRHSFVVIPSLPDDVTNLEFSLTIKPHREVPEMKKVTFSELSVTLK
nr:hypothetical protein [Desulfitobacterium hafniense]